MLKLSEKASGQTGTKILQDAMSNGQVHLARFVLDALDGEIVDSRSEGATTPLITAVLLPESQARSRFMHLLLQRGASVNRPDQHGRTALSYACENGYLEAVKVLVQHNADPEAVDNWGNTALMYASVAGHWPVVDFLVRAFKRLGLEIDRQNKVGNSAVEVAKYLGHRECLFALTSTGRKSHDSAWRDSDGEVEDSFVRRSACASGVNATQGQSHTCSKGVNAAMPGVVSIAGTSSRRKSPALWRRIQSMDSIEEYEREDDAAPTSPGAFSGVPALKPAWAFTSQHSIRKIKLGENNRHDYCDVAPLSRPSDNRFPLLFSPRPGKNADRRTSASTESSTAGPLDSPLGVLLTPILGSRGEKQGPESEKQKKNAVDFGIRLFHDSYYKKRSSLPTSVLRPAPPERAPLPSLKAKTVLRSAQPGSPAPGASTSFTALGNKLLRRFTFPELKKPAKEPSGDDGSSGSLAGSPPEPTEPGMPKSETFPRAERHPQIGSKSSIDSISAVKCEFDTHVKTSPS